MKDRDKNSSPSPGKSAQDFSRHNFKRVTTTMVSHRIAIQPDDDYEDDVVVVFRCIYCFRPFLLSVIVLLLITGCLIVLSVSPDMKLHVDPQMVPSAGTNITDSGRGSFAYVRKEYMRAAEIAYLVAAYDYFAREVNIDLAGVELPDSSKPNASAEKVMVCYYNTPRYGSCRQLLPSDIDPHLCTHINIAFASIRNKEIYLDPDQRRTIEEVSKLKVVNPQLKILLSIGGSGGNDGFPEMVADHASRKTFIKSIKSVLHNYSLDGVDLDWEYPAIRDNVIGHNKQRQHFSQLLREIRAEYVREKKDYLLTIAAAAVEVMVEYSYDVDQINLYTDFVNIMTYDYHYFTDYTPFTGLNSPLYARSEEKLYLSTLNINYTCNMFMRKGLDRNKIVVGIPTYGHSFYLVNPRNAKISSPASDYGTLGAAGFVDYTLVCQYMRHYNDTVHYKKDTEALVPFLYRSHEWVSYDDPESVYNKAQFIKQNNFRGAMIYSLNADDHSGVCDCVHGLKKYPLTQSVRQALFD